MSGFDVCRSRIWIRSDEEALASSSSGEGWSAGLMSGGFVVCVGIGSALFSLGFRRKLDEEEKSRITLNVWKVLSIRGGLLHVRHRCRAIDIPPSLSHDTRTPNPSRHHLGLLLLYFRHP